MHLPGLTSEYIWIGVHWFFGVFLKLYMLSDEMSLPLKFSYFSPTALQNGTVQLRMDYYGPQATFRN